MRTAPIALGIALAAASCGTPTARAQAVPDSIAAEGVPALPVDLVRDLDRYANIRSAGFGDWLAGRRAMLVTTRFAETPQVHRVAMPVGARTQLTFGRERVLGVAARPGRAEFAFSTDEGGAENYQVFLRDERSGASTRITDGRSRNTAPRWSNSGRLLAWSGNARDGRDMDLYVADPADPKSARLFKQVSGDWSVADWSPDDRRVAAVETISANETYIHVIDVQSGEAEAITPRRQGDEPTVAYGNVRWAKDGRALYATSDRGAEFARLVRLDPAAKSETPLTADIPWDVEEFDLSDDGRLIALATNEDGMGKVRFLDATTGRQLPPPALPAGQVGGLTFRPGSHEVGLTFASARTPADAYTIDPDAGSALIRWTESETGGLDPAGFPEPALARFKTFDDKSIPAFVYRPPAAKFPGPRPVLINIHGGPEGQFRPAFLGRLSYLVSELGIALVFPNVRGSSGYGKTYLKLDNGFHREDAVKDIGALLDWIGAQPDLDARRVAVTGGSYGGFMSLAVQVRYNDRLKAGIDIVGISNFVTFLKNTQDYRRDLRRAEYGDERDPAMREFLEKVSPLTNADKIRTPLLVVQGKNDPRVPASEAEQIVAAVRKNDVPVWYVVGKNEGHGFAKKPNQDYLQAAEVLFLKRHLLGEAAPSDPGR